MQFQRLTAHGSVQISGCRHPQIVILKCILFTLLKADRCDIGIFNFHQLCAVEVRLCVRNLETGI